MGVDGLLKALQPIAAKQTHVRGYKGKRVAIDGYTWLHKASYGCAADVVLKTSFSKNRWGRYPSFVEYCLHRLRLLKHFGAHPVMIFDGGKLVAKRDVEGKRDDKRSAEEEKGKRLINEARRYGKDSGKRKSLYNEARNHFQHAVRVTPAVMAITLEALRENNFEFIIAPYEADAQLAFELKSRKNCDVIISEDSDCIVYSLAAGITSGKILFKMDKYGNGVEIDLGTLFQRTTVSLPQPQNTKGKGKKKKGDFFTQNLHLMTPEMFLQMSVMAGCDYADSIKGIGIKKAQVLVLKFAKSKDEDRIADILNHIEKNDKKKVITAGYEDVVNNAILTFKHHWVCDRKNMLMVNLNPVSNPGQLEHVIGKKFSEDIFSSIARGYIHPRTLKPYPSGPGGGGAERGLRFGKSSAAKSNRAGGSGSSFNLKRMFARQPTVPAAKKTTARSSTVKESRNAHEASVSPSTSGNAKSLVDSPSQATTTSRPAKGNTQGGQGFAIDGLVYLLAPSPRGKDDVEGVPTLSTPATLTVAGVLTPSARPGSMNQLPVLTQPTMRKISKEKISAAQGKAIGGSFNTSINQTAHEVKNSIGGSKLNPFKKQLPAARKRKSIMQDRGGGLKKQRNGRQRKNGSGKSKHHTGGAKFASITSFFAKK